MSHISSLQVYHYLFATLDPKIIVKDYDGKTVTNGRIDFLLAKKGYRRAFIFHPKKNEKGEYLIKTISGKIRTGTKKRYSISRNYRVLISAQGFRLTERTIKFKRCKGKTFEIVIEKIKQDIKLVGTIYDINGAILPAVKVTAKSKGKRTFLSSGKTYNYKKLFSTSSNNDGVYHLRLFPDEYELTFELTGFKKYVIKQFRLVNTWKGKMSFDIVLEVRETNCPYAGSCEKEKSNVIVNKRIEKYDKKY